MPATGVHLRHQLAEGLLRQATNGRCRSIPDAAPGGCFSAVASRPEQVKRLRAGAWGLHLGRRRDDLAGLQAIISNRLARANVAQGDARCGRE